MNRTCAGHRIDLRNYKDHDTSPTSIVLLCGTASGTNQSCPPLTVRNETTDQDADCLEISRSSGEFKALLRLCLGPNHIRIGFCDEFLAIVIRFLPNSSPFVVRTLFIICQGHDGHCQSPYGDCDAEEAMRKINLATELVQTIYAEKLHKSGPGRRSFRVAGDCVPFHSELTLVEAQAMDEHELWQHFAKEVVLRARTGPFEKYVAFLGCTRFQGISNGDYSHANLKRHTLANAALGGGDLALFGTGCVYTWPSRIGEVIEHFKDERRVDVERFLDDSNGRRTLGGCWATNLGSLCHEIGHIFALGHTKDGIMGGDVDFVGRVFTVDNLTYNLADRVVDVARTDPKAQKQPDSRLTNLQRKPNRFLDKYRQQKDNDMTYFSVCSAIVLTTHKWLRDEPAKETNNNMVYCKASGTIRSEMPLRLIELRTTAKALMQMFFSFESHENMLEFRLPQTVALQGLDLFVIDVAGNCQTFAA